MPKLIFTEGVFAGQEIELPDSSLIIGRAEEANLVLEDNEISGRHAELQPEGDAWRITDLDSSNGTALNGEMVETALLSDGDIITMGETVCTFRTNGAAATGAAPEPEATPVPEPPTAAPPTADTSAAELALVEKMKDHADAIRAEVGKVIVGQIEVLDQILMCIIAHGHALLIGLPGMAKTLTVSTIAKVLGLEFKRIQFTPDLMPTDITGTEILESNRETGEKEFRFVKGPIFCNLLLADEINRTPPKTQAALLEAMQERGVTAAGHRHPLPLPFFVLATQNPIEQEGTYPLPEAQLDRFMFNIRLDYPSYEEEVAVVKATTVDRKATVDKILDGEQISAFQHLIRRIPIADNVLEYAVDLAARTRPGTERAPEMVTEYLSWGAGPRASQFLVLGAKAHAAVHGKYSPDIDDVRAVAEPILRHRIVRNYKAEAEGITLEKLVAELL